MWLLFPTSLNVSQSVLYKLIMVCLVSNNCKSTLGHAALGYIILGFRLPSGMTALIASRNLCETAEKSPGAIVYRYRERAYQRDARPLIEF